MENKQDKGFTLVELLIVIVILGILATVTVFAVRGITDQGQDLGLCTPIEKTLIVALEAYYAQEGNLAGDAADESTLVTEELLVSESASTTSAAVSSRWRATLRTRRSPARPKPTPADPSLTNQINSIEDPAFGRGLRRFRLLSIDGPSLCAS